MQLRKQELCGRLKHLEQDLVRYDNFFIVHNSFSSHKCKTCQLKSRQFFLLCSVIVSGTASVQVFDITSLQIFSPHELDYLLCGHRELWKVNMNT